MVSLGLYISSVLGEITRLQPRFDAVPTDVKNVLGIFFTGGSPKARNLDIGNYGLHQAKLVINIQTGDLEEEVLWGYEACEKIVHKLSVIHHVTVSTAAGGIRVMQFNITTEPRFVGFNNNGYAMFSLTASVQYGRNQEVN